MQSKQRKTEWVGAKTAAALLRVSHATACRWAKAGRFPGAVKIGTVGRGAWAIPRRDVLALLTEEAT